MTLLQFIATLVGGLGIGSLIATVVNKWLEARVERARWLRDRRHAAYSALAKELMSMGVWSGVTVPTDATGPPTPPHSETPRHSRGAPRPYAGSLNPRRASSFQAPSCFCQTCNAPILVVVALPSSSDSAR